MKKTINYFVALAGLLLAASLASAQTVLTTTTLSAAVPNTVESTTTTGNMSIVSVASATGISAPTPNTGNTYGVATSEAQTYLFVDRELMEVKGVSGTTITVIRGVGSTSAAAHASSALVFIVPVSAYITWSAGPYGYAPAVPQGACTRSNELYLPRIQFVSGLISDCNNGQWVNGDALQTTRLGITGSTSAANGFRYPDPGGTAISALETSGTAPSAATQIYCTEIDLPFSMLLSGLAPLNGTTVGTDKHWVLLYDAGGSLLANSAAAGAVSANATTYQKYSFVTPYFAVGPARYFGCVGSNGTTDTLRHSITGTNDNILGGAVTGQVFGTAASTITAPSTYTTAKAPYYLLF